MSSFRFASLRLCVAHLALAPFAAGAPSHSTSPAHSHSHTHTPAPPAHAHGVVTLEQFVTSAAPFARNQVDLAQSTTVLSGRSLLLKQRSTLGDTLASEPGMHATSFGPGASRPIIRGLGGDRIRLLENSVGTLDASVASPDHAVSVEPFLVERIEVVRGPASLLYGSNAVGGVVNVITHRIETDLPSEPARGTLEMRGGTAADEFARGGVVDLALKPAADRALVLHVDGFRRDADDLRIPGFAESERVRAAEVEHAAEHGEPAPEFARDRLPNSALSAQSGAAGVSFITPVFHVGASYSGFETDYGVPGHGHAEAGEADAGVRIDLRQRRTDLQAEWHGEAGPWHGARFKLGVGRYRHREIEPDGVVGTVFTNRGHDARLELLHGESASWSGAIGVQSTRSRFAATGEEAFLPASRTDTAAVFAFEEIARGALTWQFGARFERSELAATGNASRREDELSASAGAVWKIDPTHTLALSLTHTGRAPNAQELFAWGAHAGTQSFEQGDPSLEPERALGIEASLRRRTGRVTGAVTVFAQRFRGFIFQDPTGLVAHEHDDGAWEFVPAAEADHGEGRGAGLPVYRATQREARFWGAELEAVWHLHESQHAQLDVRLTADLTRARESGRDLPRIPAARTGVGVSWATAAWSVGAECQFVFRQDRVAPNESPSDDYALLGAHVSRAVSLGKFDAELFLRGTNLFHAEARPHTSFVKELVPLAGRAATAGIRVAF